MWKIAIKFAPLILIVLLVSGIVGGFLYFQKKIESLERENAILLTSKADAENSVKTLQQMIKEANDQIAILRKNEEDAINTLTEYSLLLDLTNMNNIPKLDLKNKINEYEKCMVKNFNKPEVECKMDF